MMFADKQKTKIFGLTPPENAKMDFDFPQRAKLRELLTRGDNFKLISIDLCHKKNSEALFGIRLNYTENHTSEFIRTPHYKTAEPTNYAIDQSKRIGKVGARVDEANGQIYGIRFQEEDGSNILSVNWVDMGTWIDQDIPNGVTIIGCFGKNAGGATTRETTASSSATKNTTEVVSDGADEKYIQSLGFNLWKWS